MKSSTIFAEDLLKHYGALVTIQNIMDYTKQSRDWVRERISRVPPLDPSTRKKVWFYQDVAKALYGENVWKI